MSHVTVKLLAPHSKLGKNIDVCGVCVWKGGRRIRSTPGCQWVNPFDVEPFILPSAKAEVRHQIRPVPNDGRRHIVHLFA